MARDRGFLVYSDMSILSREALSVSPERAANRAEHHATLCWQLVERAPGGVALVVDDLDRADPTVLDLTEHLIRRPPPGAVLVVLAFQGTRPPGAIADAIDRLHRGVWQIRPRPLTAGDLHSLLPGDTPERRDALLRASHGNPLYLTALIPRSDATLAELLRDGGRGNRIAWFDEPTRRLLRAGGVDLAGLSEPARQVAHGVAVIRHHATDDLIADVAELPPSTVVSALDELCAMGIAEVDGDWFSIRHPLVWAAAHDLEGPAARLRKHAKAATYLGSHQGPLLLQALHLEHSARYGDDGAVATLLAAGGALVIQAPQKAAGLLAKALRILSPASPLSRRRPEIQLQYARALGLAGQLGRSWGVLQQLLGDGGPHHTEALSLAAMVARLRGDFDTAAAHLGTALGRHPVAENELRVELAALEALHENPAATLRQARRASRLLDGRQPVLAAAAESLCAWSALYLGRSGVARTHMAQAARLVDGVSDVALGLHVELLGPLCWVEFRLGRVSAAACHMARALDVVARLGDSCALPYLHIADAMMKSRQGRLAAALALGEQAALTADRMGSPELRAMAEAVRLRPLLWTEGPAATIASAGHLVGTAGLRSRTWRRLVRLELVVAHTLAGDIQPALDLLTDPKEWPADPLIQVTRQATLAQALTQLGDLDAAQAAATGAEQIAADAGLPYELGLARYASAHVAAEAGDAARAGTLAEQSAAQFADAAAPVEEARAHHLAGIAFALAGQPRRSQDELGRAKAGYAACDATWLLVAAARDQRSYAARLPRHGRPRTSTNMEALTSRERQVADLVAFGLTNQEIANRLFVSRRTVESHLFHIYPKLNVHSRAALTRRLTDHTLSPTNTPENSSSITRMGAPSTSDAPRMEIEPDAASATG